MKIKRRIAAIIMVMVLSISCVSVWAAYEELSNGAVQETRKMVGVNIIVCGMAHRIDAGWDLSRASNTAYVSGDDRDLMDACYYQFFVDDYIYQKGNVGCGYKYFYSGTTLSDFSVCSTVIRRNNENGIILIDVSDRTE